MRTYSIDLHTHSTASPDGSLTVEDYRDMLQRGGLDYIAVTDHDTIVLARQAHAELGDRIIIGEEITTQEGELVGLFLHETVAPGLSASRTVDAIHRQGGLVYVPHPFETVRHGLQRASLDALEGLIDIMEVRNGRALVQNKSSMARRWAAAHGVAMAASSDAHGRRGWGRTYTITDTPPTAKDLPVSLSRATRAERSVGLRGALYPKLNRLRKRVHPRDA